MWVQEEPVNMGAWGYLLRVLNGILPIKAVTRRESASPATGSHKTHEREQEELLKYSLGSEV